MMYLNKNILLDSQDDKENYVLSDTIANRLHIYTELYIVYAFYTDLPLVEYMSTFKSSVRYLALFLLELFILSVFALLEIWKGHLILTEQNMWKDTADIFFYR